uniref:SUEL-type lectin domain-containing protein n=1 Tax=Rhodnius prolixus TaxID=13249 RepID=T1HTN3_RHOPR
MGNTRNSNKLDKTELVCDFEEMILSCPDNYHIDVLSAMYGKIDDRYCYQRHKRVDNCEANSLTTLNQVRKKCNRLQYCSLMAHSKMLGNPCKGIRKYLEVTYRCLRSGHLKVVKAFYGRTTKPYCLDETKDIATTCEVSRATFLVQNRCNEWRNCTFTVNSKMIRDDACRSAFKFLEVLYFCERSGMYIKVYK